MENQKPNARALLPILIFLILDLGIGIFYQYISPVFGKSGFQVISVELAFLIAFTVALLQNRKLSFEEKIHLCAKGIGDDNIVIILLLLLFAGMFSGIAYAVGGAASTANLFLSLIPKRFVVPGLFLITCLISTATGTSMGTISVLTPISTALAHNAGLNLPLCTAIVVCGALFGDNLSFISDTTIAATKTQGVEMKDKFRMNFKIALPAALLTIVVLLLTSLHSSGGEIGVFSYSIVKVVPYFLILIASLFGLNVLLLLGVGTVLFLILGMATHSLTVAESLSAMGEGMTGMFETIIITLLVTAIGSLVKYGGGFAFLLQGIRKHVHSEKGGMAGIFLLSVLIELSTAHNTVSIILAAPIAREITEEYGIDPRKTASLLDTGTSMIQGIVPYGSQLLVAAGLAGISTVSIIPYAYYQYFLAVCVILSIVFSKPYQNQAGQK